MVSDNPETFADLDGHLIQGGPYNLETAEPSGGCDYMSGCPEKEFDEDSSIPDWYLSEVSAQRAQQQAQQHSCGFWCRLFHTDRTPAKFVILPKKTRNMGSYSIFVYQLENKEGQKLGNGYSVEEHLWSDRAARHHMQIGHNSEGVFVPLVNGGKGYDRVGYVRPGPGEVSYNVYQTFTVKYRSQNYKLATEFEHETVVDRNRYINNVVDIVP